MGYGMPSSHAQFVAFFSISLTFFLLLRHNPAPSSTHKPTTFLERLLLSIVACICASAVAVSRIYLNYHTPKQVLVGVGAGAISAVAYFILTTLLRRLGWVDWALELWVSRAFRMRDLVVIEDLADAGWGRWEARRLEKRNEINGDIRKHQ